MMPISNLWSSLQADLYKPALLWQIGTIVVCIGLGWILARMVRGRLTAHEARLRAVQMGVDSFSRVSAPLIAFVLLVIARPILAQWHQVNLLHVAIPLVGSFALIRLTFYVLRQVFAHGGRVGKLVLLFEKLFALLVWVGVALYITGLWADVFLYLEQTVIPIGRYKTSLLTILQAAASVAVTLILALWAGAMLEERLMRLDTMHSSLRAVMARMVRASLILIAVLVSLSLVGIDLTVLSVFGGALGVGLGLGLQKIVSSYVSGFVILLERSLAIGDMVTVDKYYGQVTRINTRYTIVRSLDGIESVIPNEMLVASPVQNYSLSDSKLRIATQVTLGYETDIDHISPLLVAAVGSVARVLDDPKPQVLLMKFGADGLELEIGFWFDDPENGRSHLLSEVNRAIWQVLQTQEISVPYPQRAYRIIDSRPKGEDGAEAAAVAADLMYQAKKR